MRSAWVYSRRFDLAFIIGPPAFCAALLFLFPGFFDRADDVPTWAWIFFLFGTEYAHQYASFYRTYLDPTELKMRPKLFVLTPLIAFGVLIVLNSFGPMIFWRTITYLAAFHFMRQQYGFMRLYSRHERAPTNFSLQLDALVVYAAAFFPLFYYHTHMPRNYAWADISGKDVFFSLHFRNHTVLALQIYLAIIALYSVKEAYFSIRNKGFNWQKNLLIIGTLASWYAALVSFNSAFAFYFFTQMMHSVPYIALIWAYGNKKWQSHVAPSFVSKLFRPRMIVGFLGLLSLFAFVEVGLWKHIADYDFPDHFAHFTSCAEPISPELDCAALSSPPSHTLCARRFYLACKKRRFALAA